MKYLLLVLFPLLGHLHAAVHPGTVSPSGRYRLASTEVIQRTPDRSRNAVLGSTVSLLDAEEKTLSKCFHRELAYIDVSGRDDWSTKAYWNDDETMVAVHTGGRTWSRIDFYSIRGNRIIPLPHPDWTSSLFGNLPGSRGETTRLYESFTQWDREDHCTLEISGTAFLDESQEERYLEFSYKVSLRPGIDGIEILSIGKQEN